MTIKIDDPHHPMWEMRPVESITRRERIATAVLAGIYADSEGWGSELCMAQSAVRAADALIAELDKEPGR